MDHPGETFCHKIIADKRYILTICCIVPQRYQRSWWSNGDETSLWTVFFAKLANEWWRNQMETFSALLAFVRGIHRSPVNSPHKGQWRGALMFSLICAWINGWVNSRDAGGLRRHSAHYDITVMEITNCQVHFGAKIKCVVIGDSMQWLL